MVCLVSECADEGQVCMRHGREMLNTSLLGTFIPTPSVNSLTSLNAFKKRNSKRTRIRGPVQEDIL
jgi:hypothetical protein